jgi:hypothetical protein
VALIGGRLPPEEHGLGATEKPVDNGDLIRIERIGRCDIKEPLDQMAPRVAVRAVSDG